MSPDDLLNDLRQRSILNDEQRQRIAASERSRPFSLHWELRALLYAGILLLSSGLGLLVYDNFDHVGHGILLLIIAAACVVSFVFAWLNRPPWTTEQATSRSAFGAYALLLACLLFLTLEGYAQYQYNVFGTRYGLVTFVPAMLFLALAYRFDHKGVLSMALTALISWVGITVRPLNFYFKTNFFDQKVVFSAIGLALVIGAVALVLERQRIKSHFTLTHLTFAGNLLLVALLAGLFNFEGLLPWFMAGLAAGCWLADRYARQEQRNRAGSFLFLLMSAVYGYIGLTYLYFKYLHPSGNAVAGYVYFIVSGIVLIAYLLYQRRSVLHESI
ncbi:DUF2157 domain-containing protein [Fibrisoma montanum]|uniref:DUF2157 domain-containing protein n=1 Tax=Fibrisoma montanum TaxID=2305895 RepID=A0A418MHI2_9BACT|nr:DUF2157 domain-containing protein [Fibrisoma montanum]RIV26879.1 DUF2157 domain-containing protein [Fibrisoma montanum]